MRRFLLAVLLCVASASVVFGSTPGRARVVGWGRNSGGQANPPCGPYVAVAAGTVQSLALREDGTVYAWGKNGSCTPANLAHVTDIGSTGSYNYALRDDGNIIAWNRYQDKVAPPLGHGDFAAIDARDTYSLALKSDGTVVSYPERGYEYLAAPSGLVDVVAISAGVNHCLALKSDGTVVGWGRDDYSQATPPLGLSGVVAIDAGTDISMALKSDGTVACWGAALPEEQPAGLSGVTAISAGYDHCLALKSDGTVVGWGSNTYGQATPPADLHAIAISAGQFYSLAVRSDGTIVAWGSEGEYGQGATPPDISDAVQIGAGIDYAVALKADGTVVKWGSAYWKIPDWLSDVISISAGDHYISALRSDGRIGLSPNSVSPDLYGVIAVAQGTYQGLALKSDGSVVWPSGEEVAGLTDITAISAAWYHSLALKSDGTVVGLGTDEPATPPQGLADVIAISAERSCSLAVKSDGTVVRWGSIPFAGFPSGFHDVAAIDLGIDHGLALKTDETVEGFGNNSYGQCTPPVELSDVRQIAAGRQFSLALISPNNAPSARAGLDRTVEATGVKTTVTLDGTATSDPDGDDLSYRWTLPYPWPTPWIELTGVSPTLELPVGKHSFSLLVKDPDGMPSMDGVTITVQDTTPPVFVGVPPDAYLTATSSTGAYYRLSNNPLAVDAVSGNRPVSCSHQLRKALFPLGTTTVVFTASDTYDNAGTASFNITVTYSCSPLLLPSAKSALKCGSSVPVHFKLTGASSRITDTVATLYAAPVSAGVIGEYVQVDSFTYDADSGEYVAKWSTKDLELGPYRLKLDLGDGVERAQNVILLARKPESAK